MTYINTNALPPQHVIEAVVKDPIMTDTTHFIITNAQDLIFLQKFLPLPIYGEEDEPGFSLEQCEIPLGSLPWVVDLIENKFWKQASQGGLPNGVLHINKLVDGEDLLLRFSPNCGREGEKGFTLQNFQREDYTGVDNHQSVQLPNRLLRDAGLLDLFKQLIARYQLPFPEVKEAPPPSWNTIGK